MQLKLACMFLFGCVLLTGCTKQSSLNESSFDTLVTEGPDTTIDPLTGVPRNADYNDPASAVQVLNTFDSLQEINKPTGVLNDGTGAVDTEIKLCFYDWTSYDEPEIKPGEKLTAVFSQSTKNELTYYTLQPATFQFDSLTKDPHPPWVGEHETKPVFYLKGIPLVNVKGLLFPDEFFEPGDSLSMEIGDKRYTFYAEGKSGIEDHGDWTFEFVKNYRLVLLEKSSAGTSREILFARDVQPFPNNGDMSPDYIIWSGDLNDDGFLDIISLDAVKSCASYYLWLGASSVKFKLVTRFSGCGC
jgi:hypothetical protein